MQVFVECEADSPIRRKYNPVSFKLEMEQVVNAAYPYPYGFIPGTVGEDGDPLDCYLITNQPIRHGILIACEPLGTIQFHEGNELDYKVLMKVEGDLPGDIEMAGERIKNFIRDLFKLNPQIVVAFGFDLDQAQTVELIRMLTPM